jgi:hypothetical protein
MSTNFWIHIIVFITVFTITGIIISRKAKKKNVREVDNEFEEIKAEIFEAEDLRREAKEDRDKASEELRNAEELKRKAKEELEKIRAKK